VIPLSGSLNRGASVPRSFSELDGQNPKWCTAAMTYIFRWDRHGRKGEVCEILARGTMNSCLVQFEDGYTMVTSRNALRTSRPRIQRLMDRGRLRPANDVERHHLMGLAAKAFDLKIGIAAVEGVTEGPRGLRRPLES
jgi:hypothetical protein